MTTPMSSRPTGNRGLVGSRHLIGVQTFDIARLTSQAVPIVPGTFVAVSGIGPQADSNGSGKTSFQAAVSVLLADPQWKLSINGGRFAANLLFKPDAAGLDPAQRVSAAPHGYIVGVFTSYDNLGEDPLTVWVRVSTSPPYVEARWSPGLLLSEAETDAERDLEADALWKRCEPKKPISARKMGESLYGDAPRCLTYLDTQMRPRIPSLLSQQMTEMAPETIGDSLIALAGLDSDLASETEKRGKFLRHEDDLAKAVANDLAARAEEEADLSGIASRKNARENIEQALEYWRRYVACRLQEACDHDRQIEESIKEIRERLDAASIFRDGLQAELEILRKPSRLIEDEKSKRHERDALRTGLEGVRGERLTVTSRLTQLASERPSLHSAMAGWSGVDVDTARNAVTDRTLDLARAQAAAERASTEVFEAEDVLELAEAGLSGRAGQAIQILDEIDIKGLNVLDVVNPEPQTRDVWEARLWPWRDAVAVPEELLAMAAEQLATRLPGAQLVGVGEGGVEDFLSRLEQQTATHPGGIVFPDLNVAVVSGFDPPIMGKESRVRAATERLTAAKEALSDAHRAADAAANFLKVAEADLTAAQASERLAEISSQEEELNTQFDDIERRLGILCGREEQVEEAWENARIALKSIEAKIETTKVRITSAKQDLDRETRTLEGLEKQRAALAVNTWLEVWSDDAKAANEMAAAERSTPETLKRRASELLREALRIFGVESGHGDDVPADIREAAALREKFSDSTDKHGPSVIFGDVSAPLLSRIAGAADNDLVTTARVTEERQKRQILISELRVMAESAAEGLRTFQDMLEIHIERILGNISEAYNSLDLQRGGTGARLEFASVRPEGAGDWRWHVTPRWRRSRTGPPISYRETANGAQVKVQAIQLVLAAMLADSEPHGRVLILDELGNSLGEVNRRETLRALSKVAKEKRVTILGTCQDSVLTDAADHCGHLLWFEHTTTSETYNQPTRVWGYDDNGARVELTSDWIRRGRPTF